ncbi:MAG: TRAP transporter small permease [Peptococcaceae bacterium]|jgi:TRAP-type C4-dicarboxylate transport system permease small subunit|nr:TRAP transporter small permease [Peptococcaceae bacterium]MDH7526184.1 TRAP transporter small permease [Peptococcaceae bacterium]
MKAWQKIESAINYLSSISFSLAGIIIVFVMILITFEVFARAVLGFSTLIADEVSGYSLVVLSFLGVALTFKKEGFIRIDFVYQRMSQKVKKWVDLFTTILSLLYITIITVEYVRLFLQSYTYKITSTFLTRTPLFIPQMFMWLGASFLLLQVVLLLVAGIKKIMSKEEAELRS